MDATLRRKFQKVAAELQEAFPEKLARMVFITTSPAQRKPIYVSPGVADKLTADIAVIRAAIKEQGDYMREHSAGALSQKGYDWGGTAVDLIAWNIDESAELAFAGQFPQEMRAHYYFEHELAHLILRNGSSSIRGVSVNTAESACDAFALLRHIQRYGKNTGYLEHRRDAMANRLVYYADTKHYSSEAIQKIIGMDEKYICSLSVHETAMLASQIADSCRLDADTLNDINKAFAAARELNRKYMAGELKPLFKGQDAMKVCMQVFYAMQKNETDPHIFNAGKRVLCSSPFMITNAEANPVYKRMLDYATGHNPAARPGSQRHAASWWGK